MAKPRKKNSGCGTPLCMGSKNFSFFMLYQIKNENNFLKTHITFMPVLSKTGNERHLSVVNLDSFP